MTRQERIEELKSQISWREEDLASLEGDILQWEMEDLANMIIELKSYEKMSDEQFKTIGNGSSFKED